LIKFRKAKKKYNAFLAYETSCAVKKWWLWGKWKWISKYCYRFLH